MKNCNLDTVIPGNIFSQMVANKWNSLPDNVKSHQLFNLFKNNLDNFLSET